MDFQNYQIQNRWSLLIDAFTQSKANVSALKTKFKRVALTLTILLYFIKIVQIIVITTNSFLVVTKTYNGSVLSWIVTIISLIMLYPLENHIRVFVNDNNILNKYEELFNDINNHISFASEDNMITREQCQRLQYLINGTSDSNLNIMIGTFSQLHSLLDNSSAKNEITNGKSIIKNLNSNIQTQNLDGINFGGGNIFTPPILNVGPFNDRFNNNNVNFNGIYPNMDSVPPLIPV